MVMDERRAHWEERYRDSNPEELPWFYPALDHDIDAAISEIGLSEGRVLDLGCGPGTQAIELAKRGFTVTASDIADSALKDARKRAEDAGVKIEFVRDDILSTQLKGPFDIIIDRGCFHVLPAERFGDYVAAIVRLLKEGGWLLLKCFSHKERREEGPPNRLSPEAIKSVFDGALRVYRIWESHFATKEGETPPLALFCMLEKMRTGVHG